MSKLKVWIGNLDGVRQGLVIATSKTRARKIINSSAANFKDYWREVPSEGYTFVFEPDTLYTCPIRTYHAAGVVGWSKGRCKLP